MCRHGHGLDRRRGQEDARNEGRLSVHQTNFVRPEKWKQIWQPRIDTGWGVGRLRRHAVANIGGDGGRRYAHNQDDAHGCVTVYRDGGGVRRYMHGARYVHVEHRE